MFSVRFPKLFLCAGLTIVLGQGLQPAAAMAELPLVAKVGTVPITRFQLEREVQKLLPMQVGSHGQLNPEKIQAIRSKALETLIDQACMTQYALDEKIKVDKAEVDKTFKSIRDRFDTKAKFKEALGNETPEEFRSALSREQLARKALTQAVETPATIKDEELRTYYDSHKQIFFEPTRYRISLIQLKVAPSASKEAEAEIRKKAEELAAKARAGEDFYNLAYFNSDDRTKFVGGDIGFVKEGQLVPELDQQARKMKLGDVAGPVKTDFGYNILKMTEKLEARQLGFDEARGNLKASMEKQRRETLYSTWMDALKKKYPVHRYEVAGK